MDTDIDYEAEAAEQARIAGTEQAMKAAGRTTQETVAVDYFAFEETHQLVLPDGVQWIEHKVLNEGDRRNYLNKVNRDIRLQKASGDAIMRMAAGDEKHALLEAAIVGWNLTRSGQPLSFSKGSKGSTLELFLKSAPPKIIDLIEKDIRKHNPWLMSDLSVEDIQKQIDELEEMKQVKLQEEAGKSS